MKASELIKEIEKQVSKYGDLEFMIYNEFNSVYENVDILTIHTLSNPTPDDEDAELDVFVLE